MHTSDQTLQCETKFSPLPSDPQNRVRREMHANAAPLFCEQAYMCARNMGTAFELLRCHKIFLLKIFVDILKLLSVGKIRTSFVLVSPKKFQTNHGIFFIGTYFVLVNNVFGVVYFVERPLFCSRLLNGIIYSIMISIDWCRASTGTGTLLISMICSQMLNSV